jgi:phosphoribosylanthranilate isomerase
MTYQVKICGITNLADAQLAVDAGAHYLGLIFAAASPRRISVETAAAISKSLRSASCKLVGVFQNDSVEHIEAVRDAVRLDYVQLHGKESPQQCGQLSPCIKAVSSVADAIAYADSAELLLIDRPKQSKDEDFVARIAGDPQLNMVPPFLLAGGLAPANLSAAIEKFAGIEALVGFDVASGVELAPGSKDAGKVRQFMQIASAGERHARIR